MTDNGDQAALNGLVDEFGFDYKPTDLVVVPGGDEGIVVATTTYKNRPVLKVGLLTTDTAFFRIQSKEYKAKDCYPLAGTWVEGRLRELISGAIDTVGNIYVGLVQGSLAWECLFDKSIAAAWGLNNFYTGDSPITALVAALRVLKQKEVSGASAKGD